MVYYIDDECNSKVINAINCLSRIHVATVTTEGYDYDINEARHGFLLIQFCRVKCYNLISADGHHLNRWRALILLNTTLSQFSTSHHISS